jgi:predicted aldo/keto reductase-like oxidoreductase
MFNMQYNVIPLAAAKNMGVIAMKVFADGAMYTKPAEWSEKPEHVVRTVGSELLPSQPLIKYSLTTPGVHVAIIGTGHISNKDEECQLTSNLAAAQILPDGLTETEREEIEEMAKKAKEGKTNYFQVAAMPLTAPKEVTVTQIKENNLRNVTVSWSTAYAGDAPMTAYEIWRDGARVNKITFKPQITTDPYTWSEPLNDKIPHTYVLKVIDGKGRIAESMPFKLDRMA